MRQHRLNVILLGLLVLMLLGLAGFYVWLFGFRGATSENTSNNTVSTEENTITNATNNATNTTNTTNNTTNTSNTTNTTVPSKGTSSTSGNVTVTVPVAGAKIGTTFTVTGFAKVFENVVQIRVRDNKGVILLETFVNTNAPDVGKTGTFSKSLTLEKTPTDKKGKIEFFTSNEATGAEEDKVSVSVNFQ